MTDATKQRIGQLLGAADVPARSTIEASYPARQLAAGAEAMRIAPSPTGFVHIGTVYAALLCERLAHQSKGKYFLRVEDTDKKREVVGGVQMILSALDEFGLRPDEGPEVGGDYGPYLQSQRRDIYLRYALELLEAGRAYPCFATPEELEAQQKAQQAAKVRPGYYGEWAIWRDKDDAAINAALDAGRPFVLRFRSTGSHQERLKLTDAIKGDLELPQNDLDIPLIKADGSRLPTYHLAHVVDDWLMKTTLVLRGEEWLPSTPLHIELATALGLKPFKYAHIALISVIDAKGGKRKLSKRKDPEANVQFFLEAGYPIEALTRYMFGLASSDFDDWLRANPTESMHTFRLTLDKLARSRSPLYDENKLRDYAKDVIALMNTGKYEGSIYEWLQRFGAAYCEHNHLEAQIVEQFMAADKTYLSRCFGIERSGDKARKDVARWSDILEEYGYFIDSIFELHFKSRCQAELKAIDSAAAQKMCQSMAASYDPNDDQAVWFDKLKSSALDAGFAVDNQAYKANPDQFKGNLADAAKVIRVMLTGKNRTPDLWTIMQTMGRDRVIDRLK